MKKSFNVTFSGRSFYKGELLKTNKPGLYVVTRIYDKWWWTKLRRFFGFYVTPFMIKLKKI